MSLNRRQFLLGLGLVPTFYFLRPRLRDLSDRVARTLKGSKIRSVVYLSMNGGPSQLETFDYKPELIKFQGKTMDNVVTELGDKGGVVMPPHFKFKQYGQSGAWVSEIFPHLSQHVDDIAFIKSCTATSNNHGRALLEMNCGQFSADGPCLGSWINFALGAQNQTLPGHFVFLDPRGSPNNGAENWRNAYLPREHQAILANTLEMPIPYLGQAQKSAEVMKLLHSFNQLHSEHHPNKEFFDEREKTFWAAQEMQEKARDVFYLGDDDRKAMDDYGFHQQETKVLAQQLLYTRKLLEKGARFVQIYHGGKDNIYNWDQHENIGNHRLRAQELDLPLSAFLRDLKARGLDQETLVVWGGEFGKLPTTDPRTPKHLLPGREHNHHGFTQWMWGGGIKKGITYGATDECGLIAVDRPVSHLDIQATILHILGIDYTQLALVSGSERLPFSTTPRKIIQDILS